MKLYSSPTPEAPLLSISVPTDGDSDLWSEDYDGDNEPLPPQGPIFDHGYHLKVKAKISQLMSKKKSVIYMTCRYVNRDTLGGGVARLFLNTKKEHFVCGNNMLAKYSL